MFKLNIINFIILCGIYKIYKIFFSNLVKNNSTILYNIILKNKKIFDYTYELKNYYGLNFFFIIKLIVRKIILLKKN